MNDSAMFILVVFNVATFDKPKKCTFGNLEKLLSVFETFPTKKC